MNAWKIYPVIPCESSCNVGAIIVGEDITNIPHLDGEKCVACQTCVYICPGQAIFMVDESLSNGMATVMMVYEYNPLPEEGRRCCRPGPRRAKIGRCKGCGSQENPENGSDRHRHDRSTRRMVHDGQGNSGKTLMRGANCELWVVSCWVVGWEMIDNHRL